RRHVAQHAGEPAHRVAEIAEEARDVPGGPRQALHEAVRDRVALEIDGDDRNDGGGIARRDCGGVIAGDDHADAGAGEWPRGRAPAIVTALANHAEVLAGLPARIDEALLEDRSERGGIGEDADARYRSVPGARAREEAGPETGDERASGDQARSRSSRSREPSSRRLISSRVARYRASSWPTGSRMSPSSPANSPSVYTAGAAPSTRSRTRRFCSSVIVRMRSAAARSSPCALRSVDTIVSSAR